MREFDATVLPNVFSVELNFTCVVGKVACWIVRPGTETVFIPFTQVVSEYDLKLIVLISYAEKGVKKLVSFILIDYEKLASAVNEVN